jgi:ATP diphosphatase
MNALQEAMRLGVEAADHGFDWKDPLQAMDKVQEEVEEVLVALKDQDRAAVLDELGDVLFSVVQVARLAGIDPAQALDHANAKFTRRFGAMQELLSDQLLAELNLEEQLVLWRRVKQDSC